MDNVSIENGATRGSVTEYAEKTYGTPPEFLWRRFPLYSIFRRPDNKKWYAVIMDIPKYKLGLDGREHVDILDVKCDTVVREIFRNKRGFLPAYHLNKDNWISVLLDGSVDVSTVFGLVDASYAIAKGKAK